MKPNKDLIISFVKAKVSELTKTPLESIGSDTNLLTVGVDSLHAVILCGKIEDEFDIEVEPSLMFEHKTPDAVAEAVLSLLDE